MKQLRQYLSGNMRQYGMVIALTVITLLFGILTDGNIFNAMNVSNLILQNSYLILLSVGMFFCIRPVTSTCLSARFLHSAARFWAFSS